MNNEDCFVIPLTSPKPKHIKMKNSIDFHKINGGEYGAINFNNMFPIINDNRIYEIIDTDLSNEFSKSELDYIKLVRNQLTWLNIGKNKMMVLQKAEKLFDLYASNKLDKKVMDRCCDFVNLKRRYKEFKF